MARRSKTPETGRGARRSQSRSGGKLKRGEPREVQEDVHYDFIAPGADLGGLFENNMLKCPICDFQIKPGSECPMPACPLIGGCNLVCCPRCGYQIVRPAPKRANGVKRRRSRRRE
jgi:hypothetical protein